MATIRGRRGLGRGVIACHLSWSPATANGHAFEARATTVARPPRRRSLAAATIGPRRQMQQRPAGAVNHGRRFLDFKLPYVGPARLRPQPRALAPARASPEKS